jgi:hypothetical protein
MFEHRRSPLLPAHRFAGRLATFGLLSTLIVACALAIGAVGYHAIAGLAWIDALLNAAMILTGMGPVDRMLTPGAKLFATAYALFSGVAFVSTVAVLFAPILHRFFHHLHVELEDEDGEERPQGADPS